MVSHSKGILVSSQEQHIFNGLKPPRYLTMLVAVNTRAGGDNISDVAIAA